MKKIALAALAAPAALAAYAFGAAALEDRALTFPSDYKTTFTSYLVADRMGQEDQIMIMWANDTARKAARAGEAMPDGSILIGEIWKAKKDSSGEVIESQIGRRIPTEMAAIVLMERKASWADQYPDDMKVGGWEFEVFSPAGENLNKDTTACRECHQPLDATDYTWSHDHIAGGN